MFFEKEKIPMKLGLVSAILDGWNLEEMLAEAKNAG